MRAYLLTSGTIFTLLVLVHIARVYFDGIGVLRDTFFAIATVIAIGMSSWAWVLLVRRNTGVEPNDPRSDRDAG
jgi:hypothetical protein